MKAIASGKVDRDDPSSFDFVVLELELGPTTTYRQLMKQMAAELRRRLAPHNQIKDALQHVWNVVKRIEAAGIKYNTGDELEDFELFDQLVEAFVLASETLSEHADGMLVLIDEADKASSEAHLGSFVKNFTDRLTKAGCDKVCVGLAGVTGIVQKLRASHESAPRVFSVLALKPLEIHERKEVVVQGLSFGNRRNKPPVEIAPDALEIIAVLSEGFPHFIQQFAYCAFEQDTDNVITLSDVSSGTMSENGALDQLGEKYFQQMYFERINSNEYRAVLQAMAETDDPEGWVTKEHIRRATGLKETTLGNAIYTLKDRDIIVPKAGEKGVYRLPTQSFAAWIRARHRGERLVDAEGQA